MTEEIQKNLQKNHSDTILYEKYVDFSVNKFEELNKRFLLIDIIDLRLVGLISVIVACLSKFFNLSLAQNQKDVLTPSEFITIFVMGTLLLILGSYFRIKKIQENRKAVDDASKTFSGEIQDWKPKGDSKNKGLSF